MFGQNRIGLVKELMNYKFNNILIIKPSAIGDIVMALPALSALRKAYPDAKITWLVRSEYAPLLRNHRDLNEVILFDRKLLAKCWYNRNSFKALLTLFRQLRNGHFDATIDLQGLLRTAFFSFITGAKDRFGQSGAREGASIFYNHKIKHDTSCAHVVDFYLKIIECVAGRTISGEITVPRDGRAEDSMRQLLAQNKVSDNNYIVIIPGASNPQKCWPAENFAAVAERIHAQCDSVLVLAGSESDRKFIEAVVSSTNIPFINLAGRTGIAELVALLRNARLVISNDTGPGQIAAALGVPLVILFGPTNPGRLCPYRRPETVVTADPDFGPLEIYNYDPKHNIENISVDSVYAKAAEELGLSIKS
jgi:heptosyltransferase-1